MEIDHSQAWDEILASIDDDSRRSLRLRMERLKCQRRDGAVPQQLIDGALFSAAELRSPKCLAYLAQEFGGDIHHSPAGEGRSALDHAIYCPDPPLRARMFKILMGLARADSLAELSQHWISALRASLHVGDVEIMRHLSSFIGARRFSQWLPLVRMDRADAWIIAARSGNPELIGILMGEPEMRARFDLGILPEGHFLADLSERLGHASFARDVRGIAAAKREQQAIGDACGSAPLLGRGPSPNRRM